MSNTATSLGGRFDTSGPTYAVAVGDLAAIALFVILGELRHGYPLLADAGRVVGTAIPFFIGWIVASLLLGVYAPAVVRSLRASLARTAGAWVLAALIGQGLRATPVFHGGFSIPFVIVSIVVGLVLLLVWRTIAGVAITRA